jgi:hypothetical protein
MTLGGLMQTKIRHEMIEGVSFFDSLSREQQQENFIT